MFVKKIVRKCDISKNIILQAERLYCWPIKGSKRGFYHLKKNSGYFKDSYDYEKMNNTKRLFK